MDISAHNFTLEGTANTRELGSYPLADGSFTIQGRLLRSDSLHALTERDKEKLYAYGVRLALDLRSMGECEAYPSGLRGYRDIRYVHVHLLDQVQSSGFQEVMPESMGGMYIDRLDHSTASIAQALRAILACPACTIFHCTAGKDRTGIIAMLILLLSGATVETVLMDYAVSYENIKEMAAAQREAIIAQTGQEIPEYVFRSDPEQMQRAVDHLFQQYGSAEGYCKAIGLMDDEIQGLARTLRG